MTRNHYHLVLETPQANLALTGRLRRETTLTIKAIAALAHLGTSKSANARLHDWMRNNPTPKPPANGKHS